MSEGRYAFEKQNLAGVWWQNCIRYATYKEADRAAQDRLKTNRHAYKAVRLVDTQAPGYIDTRASGYVDTGEPTVPIDW